MNKIIILVKENKMEIIRTNRYEIGFIKTDVPVL